MPWFRDHESYDRQMGQDLVIVGAGEFAQIAFEYVAHDSDYTVVAFAIDTE